MLLRWLHRRNRGSRRLHVIHHRRLCIWRMRTADGWVADVTGRATVGLHLRRQGHLIVHLLRGTRISLRLHACPRHSRGSSAHLGHRCRWHLVVTLARRCCGRGHRCRLHVVWRGSVLLGICQAGTVRLLLRLTLIRVAVRRQDR